MSDVYVVTTGCYSSYSIWGVFSTLEKAELYRSAIPDSNDIEIYTIDEVKVDMVDLGYKFYRVEFDKPGNIKRVSQDQPCNRYDESEEARFYYYNYPEAVYEKYWLNVYVWAKDKHHAIKIASDFRRLLIAYNITTELTGDFGVIKKFSELDLPKDGD